jgi:hypothetical protein
MKKKRNEILGAKCTWCLDAFEGFLFLLKGYLFAKFVIRLIMQNHEKIYISFHLKLEVYDPTLFNKSQII